MSRGRGTPLAMVLDVAISLTANSVRISWRKARPHPGRLPRGEGESSPIHLKAHRLVCSSQGNSANLKCVVLMSALSVASAGAAQSQAPSEADQIREELRQLKQDYQQRIDKLEDRLRQLETQGLTYGIQMEARW